MLPPASFSAVCVALGLFIGAESAVAQPKAAPKSVLIELTVRKQVAAGEAPKPFGSVGVFEISTGDTRFDKACPSNSNANGVTYCKVQCDPNELSELTLLVRAPGADRVPGYESPVSVEVAQRGCEVDRKQVPFVYKSLVLALGEVLSSDSKLAQAVTGRSGLTASDGSFAMLQPFEQSAAALNQLALERSPSFERFARIVRDAEVSAIAAPTNSEYKAWRKSASDYSTVTRSILLNDATTRSLGSETAKVLAPVTKDPFQLYKSKILIGNELKNKVDKSALDKTLEAEIRRTTPALSDKYSPTMDKKAMDWRAINRASPSK